MVFLPDAFLLCLLCLFVATPIVNFELIARVLDRRHFHWQKGGA